MNMAYTPLQLREIFHIESLRWFGRKMKAGSYAVKGGVNIRLFFKSARYSEDMDIDVEGVSVAAVKDAVMGVVAAPSFQNGLKSFGIERVGLPDMTKAKQTETTQRFKIHLFTYTGEDLFTKIEFSRRGFSGPVVVEGIPDSVLRPYKVTPLLVPHYGITSAVSQKIGALAGRRVTQARDIFDLYVMSPQHNFTKFHGNIREETFARAHERVLTVSFEEFRDTVVSYLAPDDIVSYTTADAWDIIKLKVAEYIEELRGYNVRP